jgi:hypothetical protein
MEVIELNEKKVISKDLCQDIENKYNQMLLTPDEQSQLFNKIMGYYQLKQQFIKQSIKKCILCRNNTEHTHNKISDIFTSTYNTQTYCKELKIKCTAKNKCQGMTIKYGIVFNLDDKTNETKKILEFIKHQIIINKNNLLYGLIEEEKGIKLHTTLLEQLKEITDSYKTQLYHVLFYSNNQHMNNDIQQLREDIRYKIIEIKESVIKENYERAIENYIDIIKLHNCLVTMSKYKSTIYSEQLFKCGNGDIPIHEEMASPDFEKLLELTKEPTTKEFKKRNHSKTIKSVATTKATAVKKQATSSTTNTTNPTKNIKKIEKIDHILNHMFILFEGDFIDQLLEDDKEFIEQVYTEMNDLKKIIKYATEEQKKQYDIINELYENKIKELNWSPNKMNDREREDDEDRSPPPLELHIESLNTPNEESLHDKFDSDAIPL